MKLHILSCVFIVGSIFGACSSQSDVIIQTKMHDFAHEISDLKPDPGIIYGKLDNGVKYAVMHNATPSGTAALRVRFATGSLNETDEQRGLAHFLEHMAFNGTRNVPEGEMIKRLERHGLQFGADTNAHTGFDETVYKLNLPNVSDEILDEAFFIMRETAENMTLDPDSIDRERGIVKSEKRTRDTVRARIMEDRLKFFMHGSRVMERTPIGTDETISNMQAPLFEAYYRQYYRPENTFVVLVGDIDTDDAVKRIKDTFSDWQVSGSVGLGKNNFGQADVDASRTGYFHDPDTLTFITIASLEQYEEKKDTALSRKERYIAALGGRILSRRLSRLSKKPNAKFLSGNTSTLSLYKTVQGASLRMRSRPDNWQHALMVGEQELRKAIQYGFTQGELDEQIANSRMALNARLGAADTRKTVSRYGGLVTQIVRAYGRKTVLIHPKTSLDNFESYADSITTDDVWLAFKRIWKNVETPHLYLQTSAVIDDSQTIIRNAYNASRLVDVVPMPVKNIGKFAYADFGDPGKIISDTYIKDTDAHLIKFENNVYLNFKRTDFAKDRVSINVKIGDGSLSIPRKDETLRRLAYNVMLNGGLEKHSPDDIKTLMAGKAVRNSFKINIDTAAFQMPATTVPSDLRAQLGLMTANIIAPGYRQEAMDHYFKSISAWFPTHDGVLSSVLNREVPRLIRSGDKRFGFPNKEEAFYTPTMQEVKDWIGPQLKSGVIDITIVGDVDKKTAIKAVAATFGTLGDRNANYGDYPEMTRLQFPKGNEKPVSFMHQGEANQSTLRIYWPAPDASDITRTRRVNILRKIFQRRVIEVIREQEATTYSPGVGLYSDRTFPNYGYIFVTLSIEPENISAMIAKIHEIAADFQTMNISQDEFNRAIKPVIEKLDSSLENNGYWMGVLSNAQTDGQGIDDFRTRDKTYKDMQLSDIKPLAADIFRRENAFHVQIVPAETVGIEK